MTTTLISDPSCLTLLKWWQSHNYQLGQPDADKLGVTNLSRSVYNLRKSGVPVLSRVRLDLGESFKRYWLECTCRSGECYVHYESLKVK